MGYTRSILYGVALPGLAALTSLAAIVLPNGDQLGWLRFSIGMAVYLAVQVGGSIIAGCVIRRRTTRA